MGHTGILDTESEKEDIFRKLRSWIKDNLKNGTIQPRIFVRGGFAYAFTVKSGDVEVRFEVNDQT